MRKPLVLGNWKMHGTREAARSLAAAVRAGLASGSAADVGVCPPFVFLEQVAAVLAGSTVALGAQTVSQFAEGAYTGEISCHMLREFGCHYVLVGHSERRQWCGESPEAVIAKLAAVIAADMVPVLCVGESLAARQAGDTFAVIAEQLEPLLQRADAAACLAASVIAYEPVWAIGTGETATPAQAQAVHAWIRAAVARCSADVATQLRILYGGSVKPDNADALFAEVDIDGGLIGGAALKAEDFCAIVAAAAASSNRS